MSELISGKMKEAIQQILEYLKFNNTITTTKGMEVTGKSEAQVRRYLKMLTDCGVVKSKKQQKEMFIQDFNAIRSFQMSEL